MIPSMDELLAVQCGQTSPISLLVTFGNTLKQTRYLINKPYAIVGRHANCDVPLRHPHISKQHIYLQVLDGRLFCVDQGSRKGIHWKDKPRLYGWLDVGEWIQVGPYRIVLQEPVGHPDAHTLGLRSTAPFATKYQTNPKVRAQLILENKQSLPLLGQLATIGRSRYCNLELSDEDISRVHASIVKTKDGSYWLIDLMSRLGMKINDKRHQSVLLKHEDLIRIGNYSIPFRIISRQDLPVELKVSETVVEEAVADISNWPGQWDGLGMRDEASPEHPTLQQIDARPEDVVGDLSERKEIAPAPVELNVDSTSALGCISENDQQLPLSNQIPDLSVEESKETVQIPTEKQVEYQPDHSDDTEVNSPELVEFSSPPDQESLPESQEDHTHVSSSTSSIESEQVTDLEVPAQDTFQLQPCHPGPREEELSESVVTQIRQEITEASPQEELVFSTEKSDSRPDPVELALCDLLETPEHNQMVLPEESASEPDAVENTLSGEQDFALSSEQDEHVADVTHSLPEKNTVVQEKEINLEDSLTLEAPAFQPHEPVEPESEFRQEIHRAGQHLIAQPAASRQAMVVRKPTNVVPVNPPRRPVSSGNLTAQRNALARTQTGIINPPHVKLSRQAAELQPSMASEIASDEYSLMDNLMHYMKQMQQEMMSQMRMNMEMMAEFMGNMQKQQSEMLREELAQLGKLNKELLELRQSLLTATPAEKSEVPMQQKAEPAKGHPGRKQHAVKTRTSSEKIPHSRTNDSQPVPAGRKEFTDPQQTHAWISKRIAMLEQERQTRWEKMKSAFMGK